MNGKGLPLRLQCCNRKLVRQAMRMLDRPDRGKRGAEGGVVLAVWHTITVKTLLVFHGDGVPHHSTKSRQLTAAAYPA